MIVYLMFSINLLMNLNLFKSEVAREISITIPTEFASTLNVIYFPQLGYLVTVPLKPEWKEEEDFKIDGLYYQVKILFLTLFSV